VQHVSYVQASTRRHTSYYEMHSNTPSCYYRDEVKLDFIVDLNAERDTRMLQSFYETVPLRRQRVAREVLELAGRVVARSPFYQDGLLRILQALADSPHDGDEIYSLCLDSDDIIRGTLIAVEPDSAAEEANAVESMDLAEESVTAAQYLLPRILAYSPTAGL
jgi:hypothetical protein